MSARDSGKTPLEAVLGEIVVTAEKLTWLLKEGQAALQPSRRRAGVMVGREEGGLGGTVKPQGLGFCRGQAALKPCWTGAGSMVGRARGGGGDVKPQGLKFFGTQALLDRCRSRGAFVLKPQGVGFATG